MTKLRMRSQHINHVLMNKLEMCGDYLRAANYFAQLSIWCGDNSKVATNRGGYYSRKYGMYIYAVISDLAKWRM